jgi:uncharacterized glyoxalase superfamily protein PhnB
MPAILQNHYVLAVHNVRESAKFYVDVLGFRIVAEPPGWVFVVRDNCMIMLGECPDDVQASDLRNHSYFGYLRVDDADAYLAEIRSKGYEPHHAIANKPWGMREFGVMTPDGHRIMIGHVIE